MQTIKGGGAVAASALGHGVFLWLLCGAVDFAPWERAAGRLGSPSHATEVSLWSEPAGRVRRRKAASKVDVGLAGEKKSEPAAAETWQEKAAGESGKATGGGGSYGSGGASQSYRAILHSFLDQSKTFPVALRELGLSGSVRVRFRVTREGKLEGIAIPDQDTPGPLRTEALRFLKRLRQVPVPPAEITEAELQFELPLRYQGGTGSG